MSLRIKFMLALLLTGLASVAMVGGLAYVSVNSKVDTIRRQQAAEHFYRLVSRYFEHQGSWPQANGRESFDRFNHNMQLGPELGPAPRQGAQAGAGADQRGDGPPRLPEGEGRPPRQDDDAPRLGDEAGRPPLPAWGEPPEPRGHPPRGGEPGGNPPYHFILADDRFTVLLGAGIYPPGQPLPEAARKDARPVTLRGKVVAYISPEGVLTPSKEELQYLAAVRDALVAGAAAAAVLALLLGVLLSKGLSRTLSRLTEAVRAMQGGSLLQRVPVQGRDEVAALATSFNAMSEQLARSHEELNASHQTILEQAEQLRELSIRDALTKLHNRRHFDEQAVTLFQHAVRQQRPLSVVIGDIDFFKRINDRFSHAMGDQVLRQVGEIMRSHLRLTDLVARYGGEEFVIAFPETELPHAAALCDKLRGVIESFPWHQFHPELKVTISMGVCADLAAGTAEAMLRRADTLLYRAKEAGRNQVCCM